MDSQAFNQHMADRAALAEPFGVQIEAVDRGSALAILRPATAAQDPEASLLALAQTSSAAAVDSALSTILERVDRRTTHSSITYFRPARGAVSAVALVQREYSDALTREMLAAGSTECRVDVALVDERGEMVAQGFFDVVVARRSPAA